MKKNDLSSFLLSMVISSLCATIISCGNSIKNAQDFMPNKPPVIDDISYELPAGVSASSITNGILIKITVTAHDPENKPLTYDITSEQGSFSNRKVTDTGYYAELFTTSVLGTGGVSVMVSVTDEKRSSITQTKNLGSGKSGPALTIDASSLKSYIMPSASTSFTFYSDSDGYYQIRNLDGVSDPQSATVDNDSAIYRYIASTDMTNPKKITINIAGASASDPGGKTIHVSAPDGAKNVWVLFWDGLEQYDKKNVVVTEDGTAPVASTTPANGATSITLGLNVTVSFTETNEIDQSTLANALQLSPTGGTVAFSGYTNKIATYTVSGLDYGTLYAMSLSGIKDLAGNILSASPIGFTTIKSTNANLTSLAVSDGALQPSFSPSTTGYFNPIPYTLTTAGKLTIIPAAAEHHATITINGTPVTSGNPYNATVNAGPNTLTVVVTAQDGTDSITYSINAYRAIPVYKTGQTASYALRDDGSLQKGVAWKSPRYSVTTNTIIDNNTGLEWIRSPSNNGFSWASALSNSTSNATDGHSDWRLPNIREFRSLVNFSATNIGSWLIANASFSTYLQTSGYYWTSTGWYSTSLSIRIISCDTGTQSATAPSITSMFYLPVRTNSTSSLPNTGQKTVYGSSDDGTLQKGVPWPSPRFHDNGDGTIKDYLTGLTWVINGVAGSYRTWANALAYVDTVNTANFASRNDWRLPNVIELETLVNYDSVTSSDVYLNSQGFVNVQNAYWSSTTLASATGSAWGVFFANSSTSANAAAGWSSMKTENCYVLPVRGPD